MTTRLDIINRVRLELGDGVAPYVWADALLQEYVREAVREWSLVRPARRQVSLVGTVGQRDFSLGAEVVPNGVVSVEWPAGVLVPVGATQPESPRWSWELGAGPSQIWFYEQAFELVENGTGSVVRLRYGLPPEGVGQAVVVTYLGYYAAPQQDGDILEVAQADEVALVWFVCGRAYRWLDEQRSKRGVAVMGGGSAKGGLAASDYEQRYASVAASRWRMRGLRSGVVLPER